MLSALFFVRMLSIGTRLRGYDGLLATAPWYGADTIP
jgi:hypothetical protein